MFISILPHCTSTSASTPKIEISSMIFKFSQVGIYRSLTIFLKTMFLDEPTTFYNVLIISTRCPEVN